MITIYAVMLVALGFLVATLIGFLGAPAYSRRVVRLATERIKGGLPLSEEEIRADKDRIRAECAILIHKLDGKVEEATLRAARGNIEVNRRDAAISSLEVEIARLRQSLEEHENARRVLEHTVTDRLPRVEQLLALARETLSERDRNLADLSISTARQSRALDEANQINAQQREEMLRATSSSPRGARGREHFKDSRFASEVALRAELEALRAQARDQSLLIARLEARATSGGEPRTSETHNEPDKQVIRLRQDLAEAEVALRSARSTAAAGEAEQETVRSELHSTQATLRDQSAEIARLKAALAIWEGGETKDRLLKDSKLALKARLGALDAQAEEQARTIQSLRAEVAAANERLARQAAHFRDEMRRIGVGTTPASVHQTKRAEPVPRRQPLTERMGGGARRGPEASTQTGSGEGVRDQARVSGFLKALAGSGGQEEQERANGAKEAPEAPAGTAEKPASEERRKPRLLDRITGLDKTQPQ